MAAATQFRILGPLEVEHDGEQVRIRAPKQRALLAFLLLRANDVVAQDELILELWGENAPPSARASLQNQIHSLRRLLGDGVVETKPPGYVLHVPPGTFDFEHFERLVERARDEELAKRSALLADALSLWRGPALVEFPRQPFALAESVRLEELRLGALEDRIDADLQLGREVDLVPELEALVECHPLRERLWADLMVCLYRSGRQADALASYRRAHAAFVEQLGIEPGPLLKDLQRAILVQDPALAEGAYGGVGLFERAARLLPGDEPHRIRTLLEYGAALWRLEERRQARAVLEEAMRRAAAAGERALEEQARLRLSWQAMYTDGRGVLEHLRQSEQSAAIFAELGDDAGLAQALRWQAHMLRDSGHAERAAELSQRALVHALSAGDQSLVDWCRQMLARSVALGPMPVPDAITVCETQAHALGGTDSGPLDAIDSVVAWLYAQAGRSSEALALGERVVDRVRRAGDRFHWAPNAGFLAWAHLLAGDEHRAAGILQELVDFLQSEGDHSAFSTYAADLARLRARLGDEPEAERLASAARATASSDDLYPQALWRRAEAITRAGRGEEGHARRLAEDALALTAATDHLTFHGETLEDVAEMEARIGDVARARRALEGAISTYKRKGNLVGAERADRLLRTFG